MRKVKRIFYSLENSLIDRRFSPTVVADCKPLNRWSMYKSARNYNSLPVEELGGRSHRPRNIKTKNQDSLHARGGPALRTIRYAGRYTLCGYEDWILTGDDMNVDDGGFSLTKRCTSTPDI